MNTITISPPNSIIFLYDQSNGSVEIPVYTSGEIVSANITCISVGTLSAADGETTITLTDEVQVIDDTGMLAFDGLLHLPGLELSVCSSHNERLLTMKLPTSQARVRIFINDDREPDNIIVQAQPV
ncbi:hypothetical protein [Lysobacter sp. CA199]|uniref:hypothetical protein n=1 Tax=Lysobacter sp. CA199 TaxID=3455608 RepID=UPI003F8D4CCE